VVQVIEEPDTTVTCGVGPVASIVMPVKLVEVVVEEPKVWVTRAV